VALTGSNSGLTVDPGGTSAAAINSALGFTPTTSNPLTVYAAGTAYSLTATPAALTFGTTSPSLTLNAAGTYLLLARSRMAYNAATFAAVRTTTLKLRRTNNTAADLTNGSVTATTGIITLLTYTFIDQFWPVVYTTTNANDVISLFGSIDVLPGAGTLDVAEASIVAIRLQ
jgi:hypothetical protein